MDYSGTLVLIGTPGPVPSGYFYEASREDSGWSNHSWTFWQNPFIAIKSGRTHADVLGDELKRRGVSADDASIQREFFGKWVLDSDSLLLHWEKAKNDFERPPEESLIYILGVDIGFEDADALAVLGWSERGKEIYLIEEVLARKRGLTELADDIIRMNNKYKISKMVIDEGGLGKKLAEEMRRRHALPLMPADKIRKMENVALLNDYLRRGLFKAKAGSQFAQDSFLVEIDRDKSTPDKIKVKDGYHSDIIDAVLYAFKESPAWTYTEPKKVHKWGTPEWAAEQVSEMEERAQEYFESIETMQKDTFS